MRSDVIERKEAQPQDSSGWDQWLRARLSTELKSLHTALGRLLGEERAKLERKTNDFAAKLARLSGAVDVLRGAAAPPTPKFPTVKAWQENVVYHEGDIVARDGSTYQAQRDTARAPGSQDWTCLAVAGAGFTVRGTYDVHEKYKHLDVVVVGGSSFASLKDNPGPCPGDDWQLLVSRGSRGSKGPSGERGIMGLRGERGEAAPKIQSWCIDKARYTATPIHSDGTLDYRFRESCHKRGIHLSSQAPICAGALRTKD
jgi:hypothetical protein